MRKHARQKAWGGKGASTRVENMQEKATKFEKLRWGKEQERKNDRVKQRGKLEGIGKVHKTGKITQ